MLTNFLPLLQLSRSDWLEESFLCTFSVNSTFSCVRVGELVTGEFVDRRAVSSLSNFSFQNSFDSKCAGEERAPHPTPLAFSPSSLSSVVERDAPSQRQLNSCDNRAIEQRERRAKRTAPVSVSAAAAAAPAVANHRQHREQLDQLRAGRRRLQSDLIQAAPAPWRGQLVARQPAQRLRQHVDIHDQHVGDDAEPGERRQRFQLLEDGAGAAGGAGDAGWRWEEAKSAERKANVDVHRKQRHPQRPELPKALLPSLDVSAAHHGEELALSRWRAEGEAPILRHQAPQQFSLRERISGEKLVAGRRPRIADETWAGELHLRPVGAKHSEHPRDGRQRQRSKGQRQGEEGEGEHKRKAQHFPVATKSFLSCLIPEFEDVCLP